MNTTSFDNVTMSRLDDSGAYEGVRTRRVIAFAIDYFLIGLLLIPFTLIVFVVGVLTLGLGWFLFGILGPAVALIYVWNTLGGRNQATIGMQMMGIRLDRLDGRPVDGMLAVVHTVLFWAANAVLTPLILLASLVLDRKRTLHDLMLGTVVTRSGR